MAMYIKDVQKMYEVIKKTKSMLDKLTTVIDVREFSTLRRDIDRILNENNDA